MKHECGERFYAARESHNYCSICGDVPQAGQEPNRAPLRFWCPDDGWKIGTLCKWCADEALLRKPKESDYAYRGRNGDITEDTDEDPTEAL